jgi:hypothetical protein
MVPMDDAAFMGWSGAFAPSFKPPFDPSVFGIN